MTWLRAGLRELPGSILQKRAPPSLRWRLKTKTEKQSRSEGEGKRGKARQGGERGYFQFQLHPWLKYSSRFKIFWLKKFHRKLACLKFHSRWADAHMRQGRQPHTPNKHSVCSRSTNTATSGVSDENQAVVPPLPKSQNTAEVCLWVTGATDSLSKQPHT